MSLVTFFSVLEQPGENRKGDCNNPPPLVRRGLTHGKCNFTFRVKMICHVHVWKFGQVQGMLNPPTWLYCHDYRLCSSVCEAFHTGYGIFHCDSNGICRIPYKNASSTGLHALCHPFSVLVSFYNVNKLK